MASLGFRQGGEEAGEASGAGLQRSQGSYGIECLPEEVDYTNAINDHEEADNTGANNEYADNQENLVEVPEPRAGMCFDTIDEAFKYYKSYGKQLGFPVIKSSSKKGDDGSKQYQTMSCGRGEKFTSTSSNSLKPRPSMKIDCKALIRIGKCFDGKWKIKSTVLQHNHGLSLEKSRYFPVNRGLSVTMKMRLELNDVVNIGLNKSYNSIVVEACGHENVSFWRKMLEVTLKKLDD